MKLLLGLIFNRGDLLFYLGFVYDLVLMINKKVYILKLIFKEVVYKYDV